MIERVQTSSLVISPKTTHQGQDLSNIDTNNNELIQKELFHQLTEEKISIDSTKELVENLNKFLHPIQTSLHFELHEKLNEYYVTIIDSNTKEVVREIPPKKLLDIYASLAEQLGLIVDKKI